MRKAANGRTAFTRIKKGTARVPWVFGYLCVGGGGLFQAQLAGSGLGP